MAKQRFHIESPLDSLLKRLGLIDEWMARIVSVDEFAEAHCFEQKELRLIVVAAFVEEIGRDHDLEYRKKDL